MTTESDAPPPPDRVPGPPTAQGFPAGGSPLSPPEPGQLAADRALLGQPARQSLVAVIFIALRFIRNLGAVQIGVAIVFLASGRVPGSLLAIGVGASAVGLVFMVLAWWRFTFVVDGDELLVSKGVMAQERLTIPLDRVQSVSINQGFLHRPIGVVSVSVDTAGSSAAEFEIDAVDRPTAEALQRLVAGHQRTSTTAESAPGAVPVGHVDAVEDRVLVERTLVDLIKIGASRWPWAGLVALAPLLAVADDLQSIVPFDIFSGEGLVEDNLPSEFGSGLIGFLIAVGIGVLLIGALLGTVLQVAREVVTNWNLKLIRTATGLRRTAGLFATTNKASTLNRIQAVQTDQTPVQRIFGIKKLSLPTIGEGDLDIPGADEEEVGLLRAIVFNRADGPPAFDRRISPLAVFLAVRNTVFLTVPLLVVLFFTIQWWAFAVLLLIPFQWLIARRRWRLRRWSLSNWRLAESYELVNRHTAELELIKAQTVSVSRSFFERRRGLATVRVETAEGYMAVPLISIEEANACRDLVLYAAESDRRSWM